MTGGARQDAGHDPGQPEIRVLVVEDDRIAADAHAEYVRRMDGFVLAGVANTGAEALAMIGPRPTHGPAVGSAGAGAGAGAGAASGTQSAIDLVLLDMNLPDMHGLDIIRRIRGAGLPTDIIAITAVRELGIVRAAISGGIAQYLIKPFTYSAFSEKLGNYRQFRQNLAAQAVTTTQSEVDLALAALRPPVQSPLPKGLSPETFNAVSEFLRDAAGPVSAVEVAAELALARVTARRYLEYLAAQGSVRRTARYGSRGRPEFEYSWAR